MADHSGVGSSQHITLSEGRVDIVLPHSTLILLNPQRSFLNHPFFLSHPIFWRSFSWWIIPFFQDKLSRLLHLSWSFWRWIILYHMDWSQQLRNEEKNTFKILIREVLVILAAQVNICQYKPIPVDQESRCVSWYDFLYILGSLVLISLGHETHMQTNVFQ